MGCGRKEDNSSLTPLMLTSGIRENNTLTAAVSEESFSNGFSFTLFFVVIFDHLFVSGVCCEKNQDRDVVYNEQQRCNLNTARGWRVLATRNGWD